MADLTDQIETPVMRLLLFALMALLAWMAFTVAIGLGIELGRRVVDGPLFAWVHANIAMLSLGLTGAGYAWLRIAALDDDAR